MEKKENKPAQTPEKEKDKPQKETKEKEHVKYVNGMIVLMPPISGTKIPEFLPNF